MDIISNQNKLINIYEFPKGCISVVVGTLEVDLFPIGRPFILYYSLDLIPQSSMFLPRPVRRSFPIKFIHSVIFHLLPNGSLVPALDLWDFFLGCLRFEREYVLQRSINHADTHECQITAVERKTFCQEVSRFLTSNPH